MRMTPSKNENIISLFSVSKSSCIILQNKYKDENCSICLQSFEDYSDKIAQYNCGHRLHFDCYKKLIECFPNNINNCLSNCNC